MRPFTAYLKSSVFLKWLMAISGLIIVFFLFGHASGNLLIFSGADAINQYAADLRVIGHGLLLWLVRLVLIVALISHVASAVVLTRRNKQARTTSYKRVSFRKSSFAGRSMVLSGLVILLFVFFHLSHFTIGRVDPESFEVTDAMGRHDVYSMVVASFQKPVFSILYIIVMVVAGMHLSHAITSAARTLGLAHPRYVKLVAIWGPVISVGLALVFILVPLSVLLGIVR